MGFLGLIQSENIIISASFIDYCSFNIELFRWENDFIVEVPLE